jgi:putative membrane protein
MSSTFRPQFRMQSAKIAPRRSGTLIKVLGLTAVSVAGLALMMGHARADDLPRADKSFLNSAAEAGNAEVKASKIALEKTTNPDVKSFATLMVDEHTTVGDNLKKLAATKNVEPPTEPSVAQRAKIAVLEKLDGATFDKQYVSMIGVSAHKDAVKLFSKNAAEAKDPDVKDFAAKTLPGLQHHLDMANALKAKLDAKK